MDAAANNLAAPATLAREVELLRGENKALRDQLDWFKRQLFGPGKSETLDRAQQLIALEAAATPAPARPVETITYQREKGPRAPRPTPAETFAHLPVKETVVIVPDEVQAQPEAFEQIGEERTFEVDIVAPQLFRREIVRPKFRRKADRTQPPVLAPAPVRPVVGGYASAGLLAWVIIAKFIDHLPLFRQEKMLTRWGARISRQTLGEWVALVSDLLEPLHKLLLQQLRARGYLQVDETPIRCQDPDHPGSTVQGYLLAHWEPLAAHCRHSRTRLDNNLVENAVRPTKLGAKNWLFVGHPDAGPRIAILYSLLITCQRHGKDPLAYLRDVLARLPTMTNRDDLAALLPANWQPPAVS